MLLGAGMGRATEAGIRPALEAAIIAIGPDLSAWRRDIHQHPELSNREFRTAAKIARHLESLGLEVRTGVAHTGVVGLLRGGKPGAVVALRADMDALPITEETGLPFASTVRVTWNGAEVGVAHACGHDAHVAILMGVARVLASVRDELPGSVKFIFQPAEEGAPEGETGGAALMIREGVFADPDVDAIFGLHVSSQRELGRIGYSPGSILASADDFRITVRGRQAHAAYPWSGIDPVLASAHIITALQSIVSRQLPLTRGASVVTVASIHGGMRSNIIPGEVVMTGTVRTLDPASREPILENVRRIATDVAAGFGASAVVEAPVTMSYPVTVNDPELTRRSLPAVQAVAGESFVELSPAEMGSEDFGHYAARVPGFFFSLGARPHETPPPSAPAHHTPDFYIDEGVLVIGVRALTALALDYLESS
jgi:amidohydrolase